MMGPAVANPECVSISVVISIYPELYVSISGLLANYTCAEDDAERFNCDKSYES
jgi:hypothetical protein